jgi:Ca-activated chloride channel family protein
VIDLAGFHFLRPAWLILLLPAAVLTWALVRSRDPVQSWRRVIAPELLKHLMLQDKTKQGRFRPTYVVSLAWLLCILALAGPSWEKEPSPFTQDQAALFIVLKVTPEMLAQDIQPSRLKRATQKISDLLDLRPGTRTGLIAYAGSAHLVMPLTSDASIIREFVADLDPSVMPRPGDNPLQAIELAQRRLAKSGLPGSIVLISDYIDPLAQESLAAARAETASKDRVDVHVFAMAAGPDVIPPLDSPPAPALDLDLMKAAAKATGGVLILPSVDDSDVKQLNARIERSISRAPAHEGERWKDAGYLLLPLILLLAMFLFRPGGAIAVKQ